MIRSNRKKIITTVALMVGLAGKAKTQNSEPKTEDAKTTYTEQTVDTADSSVQKKSTIKITNFEQSTYFQWNTYTFAAPKGAKLIVAPLISIKPVIKINDRVSFGFTTNFQIHNYNRDNFGIGLHDLYMHANVQVKSGEIFFNCGQFPMIGYFNEFAKYMSANGLFINAIFFHAGPYFSHAFAGGFQNDKFMVAIGYTQPESLFTKIGGGSAIICAEFHTDDFKIGTGFIVSKGFKVNGTIEALWNPNQKSTVLLEITDIGEKKFGMHGAFKYDLKKQCFLIFNGYYQVNNGIQGATLGVLFPGGIYTLAGISKNDPLMQEETKTLVPIIEIGIKHAIGKNR